jgi:hypothetical protein
MTQRRNVKARRIYDPALPRMAPGSSSIASGPAV